MNGIIFETLTIRNFMSFGNNTTVIPLNKPGSTLINGINLDNTSHGSTSNGSGKTSILNAFVYALYDQPISDINKDNLVNNINGKHMEVSIEFNTKGHHYKIKRERKMKAGAAGNNTYFYIDGVDKTKAGKVNEQILEVIGIPYELFVRIAVFSASLDSFLDLKTAEQTSFIEELFGVNMLSAKADSLKTLIKNNEQEIQLQKVKIETLEKERDRHEQQLEIFEKRVLNWDTSHRQNIDLLTIELTELKSNTDVDLDPLYFDELRDNRKKLDEQLTLKLQHDNNLKQLKSNLSVIQNSIAANIRKISTLDDEVTKLESHQCPYCNQEFNDTGDKINNVESEINNLLTDNDTLTIESKQIEQDINVAQDLLIGVQETIQSLKDTPTYKEISDLEQAPIKLQQKIEQYEQKLIDLNNEVNPYIGLYDEMLNVELEQIDYTKINDLTNEVEHQKFLLKLLTKKDSFIRKAILNKNIPFLNSRLQYYLTIMGLFHKIEFTHEMTVNISLTGRPLSFGNLSAGQRARVNIALSIAFRDMLQHIHSKVNVWMLDEILDIGLDTVGIQAATKLIKQKAKEEHNSLYVISHRDECYGMFDQTLTVQMEKGFSYIK